MNQPLSIVGSRQYRIQAAAACVSQRAILSIIEDITAPAPMVKRPQYDFTNYFIAYVDGYRLLEVAQ